MWTYNTLVSSASRVNAAWAQVENQLQRRADLIPNLVSVTQASAQQEKALVTLLVQSRQAYLQALTPAQKAAAIAKQAYQQQRPVLDVDGTLTVGFKPEIYQQTYKA